MKRQSVITLYTCFLVYLSGCASNDTSISAAVCRPVNPNVTWECVKGRCDDGVGVRIARSNDNGMKLEEGGGFEGCMLNGRGYEINSKGYKTEGLYSNGELREGVITMPSGERIVGQFGDGGKFLNVTITFLDGRRSVVKNGKLIDPRSAANSRSTVSPPRVVTNNYPAPQVPKTTVASPPSETTLSSDTTTSREPTLGEAWEAMKEGIAKESPGLAFIGSIFGNSLKDAVTKPSPPSTPSSRCREKCYADYNKNTALANCDARDNDKIMFNPMHDCKNQLSMALNSCLNACN